MKNKHLILLLPVAIVLVIGSCKQKEKLALREPHLPDVSYQYVVTSMNVIIPPGNPYDSNPNVQSAPLDNTPMSNQTTNAGATLGRVLFYETLFSLNNTISCGSCHKQENGFADVTPVSLGYEGQKGTRNAISLANENMDANFFWDGRASTLESQDVLPIENHAELGIANLDLVVQKLKSVPYYPALFNAAFGSPDITSQKVSEALAQFLRSMHSFGSKFDQGAASGFSNFTPQELDGEAVFRASHCNSCHGGNNLDNGGFGMDHNMPAGNDWANDGLDAGFPDIGLMNVTGRQTDDGVFKIPSLRNVAVSAPYMHDGRFQTLEQVVEHYNSGLVANPNLDFRLMQGAFDGTNNTAPVKLNLTAQQKTDLVAFLNTLTDYNFITDPKFSDPFK